MHLDDLNLDRLHRGLRYSAKRNKTLFRTRKLKKHQMVLPFAMFKYQKAAEKYLASSTTPSK